MKCLRWSIPLFALVLLIGSAAEGRIAKEEYLPPDLSSFYRQAEFLGFLSQELPDLIQEGTEYDIDLFELLTQQNRAVNALTKQPEYRRALKDRGPLIEITVSRKVNAKGAKTSVIHPDVQKRAEKAKDHGDHIAGVEKLLQTYGAKYGELNLTGAITGLVSLLPAENRGAVLRRPVAGQIEMLALESTSKDLSKAFSSGFRFAKVGMSKASLSDTLETLSSAHALREKMKEHLLRAIVSFESGRKSSAKTREALEAALIEAKGLPPALKALGTNKFVQQLWAEAKRESVVEIGGEEMPTNQSLLRLKEVPGYLATLRGFVGVDCASQFCFSYGLLPTERTFFIYDPEGVALGYVMVTELEWNGKPAAYLHDLSGPRISPTMVNYTLLALQKTFQKLGYSKLILPIAERTHLNVNYKHIRKVLDQVAREGKSGELSYPDSDVRKLLKKIKNVDVEHGYDTPEANVDGLALADLSVDGLDVHSGPTTWPDTERRKLSKKQAMLLALELDFPTWSTWAQSGLQSAMTLTEAPSQIHLNRRESAQRIVSKAGIGGLESFDVIAEVMTNSQALSGEKFLKSVVKAVSELDIDDILDGHRHLLYEGLLNSSDVFESSSGTVNELALQAVRAAVLHRNQLELVKPVLEKKLDALSALPRFDEFMGDLVRDREPSLKALEWFLKKAANPLFIARHMGRLGEISKNSLHKGTRELATSILKKQAGKMKIDLKSCSNSLLQDE